MYSVEFFTVISPLIGAILAVIVNNRIFAQYITTSLVIFSSILSWYLFAVTKQNYIINFFPWLEVAKLKIYWAIYVDSLTKLMFVVVTTVSSVVHIYSIGYMSHDLGAKRFFIYLSLFTFFMLILVSSSNFLQLFFGWEGVGLCSYLLIGFWYEKFSACNAAMKAFIINRIGDLFFLLGMGVIFWIFDSLDFIEVFNSSHTHKVAIFFNKLDAISMACILLFIGCMGKSAQIGLHSWLPDAMEGPTPASALIHAATMVTAGVFLIARCSPLFELSEFARMFIVIIGTSTCFFAATVALVQTDIKKIIAYSTCSQLGYMFIACGASSYNFAVFHLMTHAFFKALLFLCAGNIIHSFEGQQNIFKMGGCWRKLPYTYYFIYIASLALAGIFPFAGFYSKDLIIESVYHYSKFSYVISNLVVFLTAFYSWRLLTVVFYGSETNKSIHESSKVMLWPLVVLAIGSIFSGFWGEYIIFIADKTFWHESIKIINNREVSNLVKFLPLALSVLGICAAYLCYHYKYFNKLQNNLLVIFLRKKWYFDELYKYCIIMPFVYISKVLSVRVEHRIIDYLGPISITKMVDRCSRSSVKLQTGMIFDYALVMFMGIILFMFLIIYSSTS